MTRFSTQFLFLNVGHLLDHLVMLIFATVAALFLAEAWNLTYDDLIPYGTAGLVAFGAFALLAGWLGDKWSREGMMTVFFLGIGACAIATGFADTPLEIGAGLLAIGVFAAIYHPVGLAMVVEGRGRTGIPIAVNGIYGNMGVALAALVTGVLIDLVGWRAAFFVPGADLHRHRVCLDAVPARRPRCRACLGCGSQAGCPVRKPRRRAPC